MYLNIIKVFIESRDELNCVKLGDLVNVARTCVGGGFAKGTLVYKINISVLYLILYLGPFFYLDTCMFLNF